MSLVCCKADIKAEAFRLGFAACGLAPANALPAAQSTYLKEWLHKGYHANMTYLANHLEKRCNPQLLVEGTRTVISVALNYYPTQLLKNDQYQFAWYAYGHDYHEVMRQKLTALLQYVKEHFAASGRLFCDTAPVLERYWAWQAGLGFIGKHTQLIIPQAGSCFFLGELFIDLEADSYDHPQANRCGTCTQCLEACPTHALEHPQLLNAHKCLSYLTIENRAEIPAELSTSLGNKIYGCDECQKACPWNRLSVPTNVPQLQPSEAFMNMQKSHWHTLTEQQYLDLFKDSAVQRATYEGLMRNIAATRATSP